MTSHSTPVQSNGNARIPLEMKQFMQGTRPSVIVSEDGVEAFVDGAAEPNGSSCDMYSGNESTAKESDMPLFECTVEGCNYRSKWKQCLTAHQFLHAGVKPYKCDFPGCNYRTNFKGNVNVHKRVHRASEFQCKFSGCNFSTPWKNSFMIHQRNHLPTNVPSSTTITVRGTSTNSASSLSDTNGMNKKMIVEPDVELSLTTMTTKRRHAPLEKGSMQPDVEIRTLPNLPSSSRKHHFELPPSLDMSINGNIQENLLNGLSTLQHDSGSSVRNITSNGRFNRHLEMDDEDDEMEDEEEEEEMDEEEEVLSFGGSGTNQNGVNHAFLMAEAANAVSQANAAHLASLRHTQGSQSDLRSSVMFDLSRYQEMI